MITNEMLNCFLDCSFELTLEELVKKGFSKETIIYACKSGDLQQSNEGKYQLIEQYYDRLWLYQQQYTKGVYYLTTALSLHNYTDHIPHYYYMMFPNNYLFSCTELNKDIRAFYAKQDDYQLGITEIVTAFGNTVKCYDKERTIIDILNSQLVLSEVKKQVLKELCFDNEFDYNKMNIYLDKLKQPIKEAKQWLAMFV